MSSSSGGTGSAMAASPTSGCLFPIFGTSALSPFPIDPVYLFLTKIAISPVPIKNSSPAKCGDDFQIFQEYSGSKSTFRFYCPPIVFANTLTSAICVGKAADKVTYAEV
jgi:hypothetical protein